MNGSVTPIPLGQLALIFIPVAAVVVLLWHWSMSWKEVIHASVRMLVQLLLVGYALTFIFATDHVGVVATVLSVMLLASSWIALRPLPRRDRRIWLHSLACIGTAGGATLALVIFGVLQPEPWFQPRYVIPLAGMIFANAMNSVSLAGERYHAERLRGADHLTARNIAYRACLIPLLNMFFAVGLVSLPGMMTGQILSGVDPLIAVRYQIMVMCMLMSASGLASAMFLHGQGKVEATPLS